MQVFTSLSSTEFKEQSDNIGEIRMPSAPSLGWQKLQDVFYNLRPCYDNLQWEIEDDLSTNYRVAISQNSTVMAVASRFVEHPRLIGIYSLSGNKIWTFVYNGSTSKHVVDFAFRNEDLCVIFNNNEYRCYEGFGGNFKELSFTKDTISLDDISDEQIRNLKRTQDTNSKNITGDAETKNSDILKLYLWFNYLVVVLHGRIIITDLDSWKNYEVSLLKAMTSKIHCMCPVNSDSSSLTILLNMDVSIFTMRIDIATSSFKLFDHELSEGPFEQLSMSPNGQLVVLRTCRAVFVINKDFNHVLLEYDISEEALTHCQVEWCGNDAIVISLKDEVRLLGPFQKSVSFFYDISNEYDFEKGNIEARSLSTFPLIKTEVDGLKVITSNRVEMLSRVPPNVVNLYQIGSSHPGSIILECIDKMEYNLSKAISTILMLKSENTLLTAINSCIEVSLEEFDPYLQKKLLKAASFCRLYYDGYYDSDNFLKTENNIKVLNHLRSVELGLFFTYQELILIGWVEFINMLLRRKLHYLALIIIDKLGLHNYKGLVYIDWCCCKIKKESNMSDSELFQIISERLCLFIKTRNPRNYLSIQKLAETAYEEGRINLTKSLINLEPSSGKIYQLLKLEDYNFALVKCFQSGNQDLCRLLLLYLQDKLSVSQFYNLISQSEQVDVALEGFQSNVGMNPIDEHLYVSGDLIANFWFETIGKQDEKALEKSMINQERRLYFFVEHFKTLINNSSLRSGSFEQYLSQYKLGVQNINSITNDKRSSRVYHRSLEQLALQKHLTEVYRTDFLVETSLHGILSKLVKMRQVKQAARIARERNYPQDKFCYLVLDVYAKDKEFDGLLQFFRGSSTANKLRSPISFLSVIKYCFDYNAPQDHVSLYISNYVEALYTERIELFIKNNDLVNAAKEALRNKDIDALKALLNKASISEDISSKNIIQKYIKDLGY